MKVVKEKLIKKNPNLYNGKPLDKKIFKILSKNNGNNKIIKKKNFYIESYGCQMNFSDTEIVASILDKEGYSNTKLINEADLILINTCSIREKAELTVRKRLEYFQSIKKNKTNLKVGVLGCMAERLKHKFLEEEKIVDMVVGPDPYQDLPNLLK